MFNNILAQVELVTVQIFLSHPPLPDPSWGTRGCETVVDDFVILPSPTVSVYSAIEIEVDPPVLGCLWLC